MFNYSRPSFFSISTFGALVVLIGGVNFFNGFMSNHLNDILCLVDILTLWEPTLSLFHAVDNEFCLPDPIVRPSDPVSSYNVRASLSDTVRN